MKRAILALSLFCGSVFASETGYDLKMDLSINGKLVSTPKLMVKAGETATILQESDSKTPNDQKTFIEVVAKEGPKDKNSGILMNFTVGVISKNGERTIRSTPRILVKENEVGQITIGGKGEEELSLSVVAKRRKLELIFNRQSL